MSMETFTLTIREGGGYGTLTRTGGQSMPCRITRPDERSILVTTDPPPSDTITEAMDRTFLLAVHDARLAEEQLAAEEAAAAADVAQIEGGGEDD